MLQRLLMLNLTFKNPSTPERIAQDSLCHVTQSGYQRSLWFSGGIESYLESCSSKLKQCFYKSIGIKKITITTIPSQSLVAHMNKLQFIQTDCYSQIFKPDRYVTPVEGSHLLPSMNWATVNALASTELLRAWNPVQFTRLATPAPGPKFINSP